MVQVTAKAILFDMDGTLLDSTPAVLATWSYFAKEYSLDLTEVLRTSHGVRTIDNMRRWCGITDPDKLEATTDQFESMIVSEARRLQDEGERGLQILPGVQDLLTTLQTTNWSSWAIVTSATKKYASAALPTAGIPPPPALITAGDVTKGKPNPEPYLAGAKALGLEPSDCIVVEDAPSGALSGRAAGCKVLGTCTSHTRSELESSQATDWIVEDLSRVRMTVSASGTLTLDIDQ